MTTARHVVALVAVAALCAATLSCRHGDPDFSSAAPAGRSADVTPELAGATIPPNIAPLNLLVREPGDRYAVRLTCQDEELVAAGHTGSVRFPIEAWRSLLANGRDGSIRWEVFVRQAGRWAAFAPYETSVSEDEIDPYLIYRYIHPVYNQWDDVRIMQRDLRSFSERTVIAGPDVEGACVNCHSYSSYSARRMTIGLRSQAVGNGTLLVVDGVPIRLDAVFGYSAWHPSGTVVAFSMNKVRQFFHVWRSESRDVVDLNSDLAYYRLGDTAVRSSDAIAREDRLETYPAWAPDGATLYFCSAPRLFSSDTKMPPDRYDEVRYDLVRVPFDATSGTFGKPEVVLPASDASGSVLLPRVSPDGRFVLFCVAEYGCFPIYQPSSDLYLLDLADGGFRRLGINSDQSESWHCWSSNGRWVAFSSKRADGLFTRTYFSHVDADGGFATPFILPQEDPVFYASCLKTFTVPEFTTEPVRVSARDLAKAGASADRLKLDLPDIPMTRGAPSPPEPWLESSGAPR